MEKAVERGLDWAGLPVIATVARLLCRELTLQNEYLRLENRILKEKIPGRLRFTDEERRSLAQAALVMGRSLMKEVVGIVKPETVKRWHTRAFRLLWRWRSRPGRPPIPSETQQLIRRLSRENPLWSPDRIRDTLLLLDYEAPCAETIRKYMVRSRRPRPETTNWLPFLRNHLDCSWAIDFFTVTTLRFQVSIGIGN